MKQENLTFLLYSIFFKIPYYNVASVNVGYHHTLALDNADQMYYLHKQRRKEEKMAGKPTIVPLQYTTQGVFVAEYASAREASEETGISQNSIYKALTGYHHTAGNFMWRKKIGDAVPKCIEPSHHQDKRPVPVLRHDPRSGDVIDKHDNVHEASRKTGVNRTNISLVINGSRYTAGGYEWKRKHLAS